MLEKSESVDDELVYMGNFKQVQGAEVWSDAMVRRFGLFVCEVSCVRVPRKTVVG